MMTKGTRILLLTASLAMGLAYVLPLWRITLEAPQYPEGLGMVIGISTIEGVKRHDLTNINNLNHYIGMKPIVPEAIPELKVMPVVLGVLMLLGVLTAGAGRRKILYGFTAVFLAVAVAGIVDFWKWEYDYGHDLDEENAIIQVPGMSYQPPLIGSRQILNFKAHSWPGAGGWVLVLAGALTTGLTLVEARRARRRGAHLIAAVAAASLVASGCGTPQPRPLVYGSDACETCLMALADEGHGAEVVTHTGRVYTFDSIECVAAWLQTVDDPALVHSTWVTDFSRRPELVRADEAHFLVSATLRSPMGVGLTAFARREDRDGAVVSFGGEALDWNGVRALVAERGPTAAPDHGGHQETMEPAGHRSGA